MNQNEKMSFSDSLKAVRNLLLTGDVNTEVTFSSEAEDANADIKNRMKKKRLCLAALVGWTGIFMIVIMTINWIGMFNNETGITSRHIAISETMGFIMVAGCVLILRKFLKVSKGLGEKYDEDIVLKAVQEVLPGAVCNPKGCVDIGKLYEYGVVPKYQEAYGSYLITYEKDGQKCQISNIRLQKEVNSQTVTVFEGQAYILNYKSNLEGYVRIMPTVISSTGKEHLKGFKKLQKDKETKVETENRVFNDNFEVYTNNEHTAFYVLTPYVMEQLMMMKRYYKNLGVAVSGNQIMIAVDTKEYLFAMPTNFKEVNNMSVENSKQELVKMLQLAQGIENSINGRI